MDPIKVNPYHKVEVNDGKVFQIGDMTNILDFPTADNIIYGFYTMRDIEITAVEAIVVEAIKCANTPGVASVMYGTTTVATVAEIDNNAANTHMPGVVVSGKIPAGNMVFVKTTIIKRYIYW
jgi:ABC-type proline/glycine betaine transport system ATPase subunit